jgi:hypothetical protein
MPFSQSNKGFPWVVISYGKNQISTGLRYIEIIKVFENVGNIAVTMMQITMSFVS